jgi:sec-independent protein translocase protein TatC
MGWRIRPVRHEDRLTLVEHLDELRARIIISLVVLVVAFSLCLWQNHLIFDLLNDPLPPGREPLTLGVTEPFFTTVTVSAYAAILIALPVLLYQLYAFVLPAFSPHERRVALPLLLMVPVLFIGGVVFGYFVVLQRAVDFLLSFNQDEFNVQIRAREYYSFVALALVALGLLFQVPVGVLAATRLGLTTPAKLRQARRYAVVVIAVLAMVGSPGGDPVTMVLLMVPLTLLYELSIVLAMAFGRPRGEPVESAPAAGSPP